jgi:hypothetical protein
VGRRRERIEIRGKKKGEQNKNPQAFLRERF